MYRISPQHREINMISPSPTPAKSEDQGSSGVPLYQYNREVYRLYTIHNCVETVQRRSWANQANRSPSVPRNILSLLVHPNKTTNDQTAVIKHLKNYNYIFGPLTHARVLHVFYPGSRLNLLDYSEIFKDFYCNDLNLNNRSFVVFEKLYNLVTSRNILRNNLTEDDHQSQLQDGVFGIFTGSRVWYVCITDKITSFLLFCLLYLCFSLFTAGQSHDCANFYLLFNAIIFRVSFCSFT